MEKIKLLLYCTKSKPYLFKDYDKELTGDNVFIDNDKDFLKENDTQILNGKIVAECDFEVEEIKNKLTNNDSHLVLFTNSLTEKELFEKSCLNRYEMFSYLTNDFTKKDEKNGYAIHIKNLHIFDKPRELSECWRNTNAWIFSNEKLYVAPQNMRYCGDWNLKKAILISIRPEWLCKILNGEKTIECRKRVLKEMMQNA